MNKDDVQRYFSYGHLPEKLQKVSAPICDAAKDMFELVPDGPQKDIAMQKMLEAKDAFVRQAI
jgi:hypothetical protein